MPFYINNRTVPVGHTLRNKLFSCEAVMSSTKSARRAELECKREREKGFILDGTVVSRLANDETDRNAPSLNFGIPQYNALTDPHCKSYFKSKAVPKKLTTAIRNPEVSSRFTALLARGKEGGDERGNILKSAAEESIRRESLHMEE